MKQSHVIDVDGNFVGAAVRQDQGFRFVAVDIRLDELDGSVLPTLADVQRACRQAVAACRWQHAAAVAKPN